MRAWIASPCCLRGYKSARRLYLPAIQRQLSEVATQSRIDHRAGAAKPTAARAGRETRCRCSSMAGLVAAGMLLSRIAGLVRESIFAHYLGNSAAADAFKAGFRIPNILQNLFGEGVLSASFIPVYSRLLGEGDEESADLLAWAVGAILALAISIFVMLGVFGRALPDQRDRAGISRPQARTDDPPGPDFLPRRGIAGDVGVVPGRAQQPSSIFRFLHGAGRVEPRDDRR